MPALHRRLKGLLLLRGELQGFHEQGDGIRAWSMIDAAFEVADGARAQASLFRQLFLCEAGVAAQAP